MTCRLPRPSAWAVESRTFGAALRLDVAGVRVHAQSPPRRRFGSETWQSQSGHVGNSMLFRSIYVVPTVNLVNTSQ